VYTFSVAFPSIAAPLLTVTDAIYGRKLDVNILTYTLRVCLALLQHLYCIHAELFSTASLYMTFTGLFPLLSYNRFHLYMFCSFICIRAFVAVLRCQYATFCYGACCRMNCMESACHPTAPPPPHHHGLGWIATTYHLPINSALTCPHLVLQTGLGTDHDTAWGNIAQPPRMTRTNHFLFRMGKRQHARTLLLSSSSPLLLWILLSWTNWRIWYWRKDLLPPSPGASL